MNQTKHSAAVLITGASTGIGRSTALLLDQQGFLVFAGVRKAKDGQSLQKEASNRLTPVILDVTDPKTIEMAYEQVKIAVRDSGLRALINNAGIVSTGAIEYTSMEKAKEVFDVNLFGVLSVTQAFLPLLRLANGQNGVYARILNVGSIGGRVPMPFLSFYNASKAALASVCASLRMELAPWNIEVILIEPGAILTPIWDKGKSEGKAALQSLSDKGQAYYGKTLERIDEGSRKLSESGISPEVAAQSILKALTTPDPKTRYLIGKDAHMMAFMAKWIPDRWLEKMFFSRFGLPNRGAFLGNTPV